MRKTLHSFVFIMFAIIISSNAQQFKDHNGWEFFDWGINKASIDKILTADNNKFSDATALDADFNYEGMNTWLYYNTQNELIKVHQRKTFSVIHDKEAGIFYDAFLAELKNNYGEPSHSGTNTKDSVITLSWDLKYTKIALEYNYKYKIIDEFGADAYWIDVIFEPD